MRLLGPLVALVADAAEVEGPPKVAAALLREMEESGGATHAAFFPLRVEHRQDGERGGNEAKRQKVK